MHPHPHPHRRRKKRASYGVRTADVRRGAGGFGFTISGQRPCILSCVAADSPAEAAGLRAGDFLVSVDGLDACKLPHDAVVRLIGGSVGGVVRLTIAENYFSDSSDEDALGRSVRKNRRRRHRHRRRESRARKLSRRSDAPPEPARAVKVVRDLNTGAMFQELAQSEVVHHKPPLAVGNETLAAKETRAPVDSGEDKIKSLSKIVDERSSLEYKAVVGYLGTIEMPERIAAGAEQRTVRGCIRKMRQEKRSPCAVLMTISPSRMTLKNGPGETLAEYPASRIDYAGCGSEGDRRFFALVTSAGRPVDPDATVSNSCHAFVVDGRTAGHRAHVRKAEIFGIDCTADPVTGTCLEFPDDSEYVVNVVRIIYSLKRPEVRSRDPDAEPALRFANDGRRGGSDFVRKINRPRFAFDRRPPPGARGEGDAPAADSPQPSEMTTASSNSDSGIGFHNDCQNISDRILVVDFPDPTADDFDESRDGRPLPARERLGPPNAGGRLPSASAPLAEATSESAVDGRGFRESLARAVTREPLLRVRSEDTVRREEHHYETIRPDERDESLTGGEARYGRTGGYSERAVDVPRPEGERVRRRRDRTSDEVSADDVSACGSATPRVSVDDTPVFGSKKPKSDCRTFLHPGDVIKVKRDKIKKPFRFPRRSGSREQATGGDDRNPKAFGISRASASVEDVRGSSETDRGRLEGAASEPDLRDCNVLTDSGSPFGRWAGGGSGRLPTHRSYRRPGSLVASEHDMYTECESDDKSAGSEKQQGGAASWSVSLERLLSEPAGVHALAAFLEREFSAENIRFWTACERWSRSPPGVRPALAVALHARHLADGAPDPVNVDASARHLAAERLPLAPLDLFLQAQKQIFNLMKFDSYPRFIKSDVYKECLLAELQGRPQPYPGDPDLAVGSFSGSSKLKKSLSNAEDRRRKSLLPWHRKSRSKSRDRCCDDDEEVDDPKSDRQADGDLKGSNSSLLAGWDVTRGFNRKQCDSPGGCGGSGSCCGGPVVGLCRVVVPGLAATSVVAAAGGEETVRLLLDKLLEKRAVRFQSYEAYAADSSKPIDINRSSSILVGKEVTVEQRVIFKLDLPNHKVVSVKAKPDKALADVLKPVLRKYGVDGSEGLRVSLDDKTVELSRPVQSVDGQRLLVRVDPIRQTDPASLRQNGKNPVYNPASNVPSLDEITNRVFEELLQGKSEKIQENIEGESIRSDNCSSEHSSGIFGRFMRRDDHRSKGVKIKKPLSNALAERAFAKSIPRSASSEGGSSCCADDAECELRRKPLIAKLRAGVNIQNAVGTQGAADNAEFLENLKQIQRARLKDRIADSDWEPQKGKENVDGYGFGNAAQITVAPPPTATPSPAPRLSLNRTSADSGDSNGDKNPEGQRVSDDGWGEEGRRRTSDPPPLPPKPKVLPIKPSNWGHGLRPDKSPYLDRPGGSFV